MYTQPYFSIIIPTFNRIDFLIKTIESFQKQTFKDFEIIVVDDGSTDNTFEVISNLQISNLRIFKKNNEERCIARNYGLDKAEGKYINYFDSDDIALDNHLETAYNFFNKNNNAQVLHLGYKIADANLKPIANMPVINGNTANNDLLKHNPLSCNGVFLEKKVALNFRFEMSKTFTLLEDYFLWLQISIHYQFYINTTITSVVIHHKSRSSNSVNIDKIESAFSDFKLNLNKLSQTAPIISSHKSAILSNAYLFISYLYSNDKKTKSTSFKYLITAIKLSPKQIFTNKLIIVNMKNILIK